MSINRIFSDKIKFKLIVKEPAGLNTVLGLQADSISQHEFENIALDNLDFSTDSK